ncbi:B3 domain-containing protein-like protein [Tanacetum coccineum]
MADPFFTDVDTFWKEITDITSLTAFLDSLGDEYFTQFQATEGESSTPEPDNYADVWPLSTKPYFCVTLDGRHLARNSPGLAIPGELHENLPMDTVPAKIVYGEKAWHLDYFGKAVIKRFESKGWGKFVKDNDFKLGDVCMFELTDGSSESTSIEFRVQFLKDDSPTDQLLEKAPGYLADNPTSLD